MSQRKFTREHRTFGQDCSCIACCTSDLPILQQYVVANGRSFRGGELHTTKYTFDPVGLRRLTRATLLISISPIALIHAYYRLTSTRSRSYYRCKGWYWGGETLIIKRISRMGKLPFSPCLRGICCTIYGEIGFSALWGNHSLAISAQDCLCSHALQ
jgi:hypothetical protein